MKNDDVLNPEFWLQRMRAAEARGEPHRAIYDCDVKEWDAIQRVHREILLRLLDEAREVSVLDAGCGVGDLVDLLSDKVVYTGIDLFQGFVDVACKRHPRRRFLVGDLRRLPFPDRSFDWVVLRSVEGMIQENLGTATWREIEAEAMRVGDRLLLLNYSDPQIYRVMDSVPDPEAHAVLRIECDGGRLLYRPGMDGCHELYDLWVDEDKRLQGIGRSLVRRLEGLTFGSVYGFTRFDNREAQAFYRRCGFTLLTVPRLYRGRDAVMFVRQCLREERAI